MKYATLMLFLGLIITCVNSFSQERVMKYSKSGYTKSSGEGHFKDRNHFNVHANTYTTNTKANFNLDDHSFFVYTTGQTDQKIESSRQTVLDSLKNKINQTESVIINQMVTSINNLQTKLLAEEAKKAIIEAVKEDFKKELDKLRADIQSQIDNLKKQ